MFLRSAFNNTTAPAYLTLLKKVPNVHNKWLNVQLSANSHISNLTAIELYSKIKEGVGADELLNTGYAKAILYDIDRGYTHVFGCASKEDVIARLNTIAEWMGRPLTNVSLPVTLDSDGMFYLLDGHHRAARLYFEDKDFRCDLDVYHIDQSFNTMVSMLQGIYEHIPNFLYQQIDHPYFHDWVTDRDDYRQNTIIEFLSKQNYACKDALVIGSCTGYTARRLSAEGMSVTGLEIDYAPYQVSKQLSTLAYFEKVDYKFTQPFKSGSNETVDEITSKEWDVITCLSVIHRYFSDNPKESYLTHAREEAKRVIIEAGKQAKFFFYESGNPKDDSLLPAHIPLDKESQISWLSGLCPDSEVQWLGEGRDGRNLYVLINTKRV